MKRTLLLFVLSILVYSISAQQFYFKKYQVDKGVSHNTVWCALQDSYGFMWFGTSDGLNRFDGQKFKVYRHDKHDKFSLGNNSVQTLFEDDKENIWIGTSAGVYVYDRLKENFSLFDKKTEYDVSISSEVKKIIRTEKGLIWIATLGQGLFIYDPQSGILKQNSKYTSFIWDLSEDKTHRICSSSLQEGLLCFDQNGKHIESFSSFLDKKDLGNSKINCIQTIHDKIWFSFGSNNLAQFDSKTRNISYYSNSQNIGTIKSISEFSEKELLVGSDNGLYLFNTLEERFTRVDNPLDPRSLSDQTVNSIVKDAEGGFWISTYLGGINYLAQQTTVFEYFYPTYNASYSTGKVISQFFEDKDQNIWIASQDGIKILDSQTQQLEPYVIPQITKKLDVRSILINDDKVWIGTFSDGLKVVDRKTKQLRQYYHNRELSSTICSDEILSLYKDSKGVIYIGTTWGVCRYNPSSDNFETLTFVGTMISVFDIIEDGQGYLWFATDNSGVFRFDSETNIWKHFSHEKDTPYSINSNSIITLFRDSEDKIWFGTNGGGLCYFNPDGESFSDFDPQNRILPNKVIYSIEEDNLGNFWISTNAGLLRVNPIDNTKRKLFTQEDGLQSNQFNSKASLKTSTGKLYFGGINGFNSFYPNDFRENNYIPPLYIVDVKLYNTDEAESNKILNLSKPIYMAEGVTLSYDNNSMIFEFEALSYEKPGRNRYSYILEGFDKDWINNDYSNMASYTNLPPGEYLFRVKGANNDNKWNEEGASLKVVILPPWWKSTLAYVIYFVLVFILLYFILRFWAKKSKKNFQLQLEEFRIEKEKEVYNSKINFFINLIHEIRTPLSLIKLPMEKLVEEHSADSKTTKYMTVINKNVNYLLNVVNQLLDFQKIESQDSKLYLKEQNINSIVEDIYGQFVHSADLNGIKLTLVVPQEDIVIFSDKEKIVKIVINLLSNAIKHAKSKIRLELKAMQDHIEIHVVDDGAGIPDPEKNKVFEAFYQVNEGNNTGGTGIGLAFSKLLAESHKGSLYINDSEWGGSEFVLSLPNDYGELALLEDEPATDIIESAAEERKGKVEIETDFKKCKILLVEDNVELLNLIEESLDPHFSILRANNGKQALEILEKENIDLVVSDVMMPVMNGLDLTKTIKTDINYSHIPVVLLTAKTTVDSKIEGMEHGADVYMEKPFSVKHLQKQIENLLKLRMAFQKNLVTYPTPAIKDAPLPNKDKEFLSKLHQEIEKHIAELEFSIDNIAETMNMSRSTFYRKIKGVSGMSPNDYLKTVRLNKAAELLLQGDLPISEICEQVAFSSSSYFAKCFKAQFGVLPKDYTGE
ncbi:MAG: two-component regulator propeller domain-containing protein [Dysgonomonas sp.]|nr:two-component regulator propeller domain-containing protein [Dysgonomonas sp.]